MLRKPRISSLFLTRLINSIKHEHSCKILYVVLKSVSSVQTYKFVMLLSFSIFCLSSNFFCEAYDRYADQLLCRFVQKFGEIYGRDRLVNNVHGLVHLAKDVQNYGPLDNFSAFIFEILLRNLKSQIRRQILPLQQVIRRISERNVYFYIPTDHLSLKKSGVLKTRHEME